MLTGAPYSVSGITFLTCRNYSKNKKGARHKFVSLAVHMFTVHK